MVQKCSGILTLTICIPIMFLVMIATIAGVLHQVTIHGATQRLTGCLVAAV